MLSGKTQAINHLPDQPWDPMIDYQMMSRFVRGFSSLMHADKPTVVKIHGYCVAGGTDIALHADQVIAAADAKIGYPPTRVWGVPAAGLCARTARCRGVTPPRSGALTAAPAETSSSMMRRWVAGSQVRDSGRASQA